MAYRKIIKSDGYDAWGDPGVRYVRIAFALIFLGGVFAVFWGELKEVLVYHHGAAVDGIVLTKPGHNHGAIDYEYSVGSDEYRGSSRADRRTEIGDVIQLHYLKRFPGVSTLVPKSSIPLHRLGIFGALVCGGIVMLCGGAKSRENGDLGG